MDSSSIARRLPDEFVTTPGLSIQRALILVHRYWPSRSDSELRELAQSLRNVLDPLLKTAKPEITPGIRDRCEGIVREWYEQTEAKRG